MSNPITIRRLPAGAVIFVSDDLNMYQCNWNAVTLAEDMLLETNEGYRDSWGQIPAKLQAKINSSVSIEMRWTKREFQGSEQFIYFINEQIKHDHAKWPDGTDILEDEHFEVAAGGLLLQYVDESPSRFSYAYDLFDYKNKIQVSTVARKYKGKTTSHYVMARDIPVGAKPGLYFRYADGLKAVHVDDIAKAAAPKERKEAQSKGPTFRQVFAVGTTWKVTNEISLPGFDRRAVTYPNGHQGFDYTLVEGKGGKIAVGTEFKVDEKTTTYGPHFVKGIWVRVRFDGTNQQWARLSDLNGNIERVMTSALVTNADGTVKIDPKDVIPVYYIFDTAEQKYYKEPATTYYHATDNHPVYSDKGIKGCKNWKRAADAKRAVMEWSGYYHNLPGNDRYDNYYTGGSKRFDIPDTWEIHEIDKTTKQVVRKIELVDSLKRSWRLRDLTVKYGSAVRQVYSDLEKKNKLDEFSAMIIFNKKDDHHDYELTDSEKDEVNAAVFDIDKSDIKRAKSDSQAAIAIKDIATGVQIRLTYSGNLDVVLIDLKQMTEVVDVQ